MNYRRNWTDSRNAVGFTAECAHLAKSAVKKSIMAALVARSAAHAAANAAYAVIRVAANTTVADNATYAAARVADLAARAGVDDFEIRIAYARWIVRDLSPYGPIDEEIRRAAGAAVVAGDEDLAREIVRGAR